MSFTVDAMPEGGYNGNKDAALRYSQKLGSMLVRKSPEKYLAHVDGELTFQRDVRDYVFVPDPAPQTLNGPG